MAEENPIWWAERSLWIGGRLAFAAHMAPDCLSAFPKSGLMTAAQVLDRVDSVPRWQEVELTGRQMHSTAMTLVLGYAAQAERAGARYAAICTSTYRRDGGMWKLIQHQQSPI